MFAPLIVPDKDKLIAPEANHPNLLPLYFHPFQPAKNFIVLTRPTHLNLSTLLSISSMLTDPAQLEIPPYSLTEITSNMQHCRQPNHTRSWYGCKNYITISQKTSTFQVSYPRGLIESYDFSKTIAGRSSPNTIIAPVISFTD